MKFVGTTRVSHSSYSKSSEFSVELRVAGGSQYKIYARQKLRGSHCVENDLSEVGFELINIVLQWQITVATVMNLLEIIMH
jgi:hypothetical protein